MEITLSEDSVIEPETIKTAIENKIPIEVFTYTLPGKTQAFISTVLSEYLNQCNLSHLFNRFNYCVNELLMNALKANSKRIYFSHKNLDIDSPGDYKMGMRTFKEDIMSNRTFYLEKQKAMGLFVRMTMLLESDKLTIEVSNNSLPTVFEYERIQEKIATFHKYTIEEINGNFIDASEGAGLGINSICLALVSLGLTKEHFKFFTRKDESVGRITYPLK